MNIVKDSIPELEYGAWIGGVFSSSLMTQQSVLELISNQTLILCPVECQKFRKEGRRRVGHILLKIRNNFVLLAFQRARFAPSNLGLCSF